MLNVIKWIPGEWGAVEGCYFTIWNARQTVVPFAAIPLHWWDFHFVSIDHGFGSTRLKILAQPELDTGSAAEPVS